MDIVDRIKFDSSDDQCFVWKYPSESIRLGSQLIVNQSQVAILFKDGKACDKFGPGSYSLSTSNIPILQRLINIPFNNKTPFSAEVWYVNKKTKRDMKWGTPKPIMVLDSKYNFPVTVRSFGRWGFKIVDSGLFLTQLVGTLSSCNSDNILSYFSGEINQQIANALSKLFAVDKASFFDMNSNINLLSLKLINSISPAFESYGIEITNFNVEQISIGEDEQKKIQEIFGKKLEIDQIGQSALTPTYAAYKTYEILDKAASNEGAIGNLLAGGIGVGVGLGAGVNVGQQLGNSLETSGDIKMDAAFVKLKKLKEMYDSKLITENEYNQKKQEILSEI